MNTLNKSDANPPNEQVGEYLLNLAVVIMGTISCYTTAVGVAPMLGNKFFAYFIAVALSLFMIVIALNLPKAETRAKRIGSIFAYSLVALFSILLNFNAIYGISNANTLLYSEINAKRDSLVSLSSTAIRDIKIKFEVDSWQKKVDAAYQEMELEKLTPGEKGCGPRCRAIYREKVLPSEGNLDAAKREAQKHIPAVEQLLASIHPEPINTVIKSNDPKAIDEGIEDIIKVYQNIARQVEPITDKRYGSLVYEERGIGNLSHTVNTIFSFRKKGGEEKAAIFVSLLISFIIDFLILFVILFLSPSVRRQEVENTSRRRGMTSGAVPNFQRGKTYNGGASAADKSNNGNGPFMDR